MTNNHHTTPLSGRSLQNALKAKSRRRRQELAELAAGSPLPHPIRNDLVPKLELVERAPSDLGVPARNVRKIEATVRNAQTMCELEAEYGSFRDYLQSHGDFEATVKDLRKRFSFLGDFGAYVFLYIVKEPVPDYHAFRVSRGEPNK